jgi:hypothetical protein
VAKTPEQIIKLQISGYLRHIPGLVFWWNQSQGVYDAKRGIYRKRKGAYERSGVSDIVGCWNGKFLAIEVKSKVGKPTEEQSRFLEDIVSHGGIAFIANSVEQVEERMASYAATYN